MQPNQILRQACKAVLDSLASESRATELRHESVERLKAILAGKGVDPVTPETDEPSVIDTGGHPVGTQAAANAVAQRKIAELTAAQRKIVEMTPIPGLMETAALWDRMKGIKSCCEVFAELKAALGQQQYYEILKANGMQHANECTAVGMTTTKLAAKQMVEALNAPQKRPPARYVTAQQIAAIQTAAALVELSGDVLTANIRALCGAESIELLPADMFDAVMKALMIPEDPALMTEAEMQQQTAAADKPVFGMQPTKRGRPKF